jgi:hypothetical protein
MLRGSKLAPENRSGFSYAPVGCRILAISVIWGMRIKVRSAREGIRSAVACATGLSGIIPQTAAIRDVQGR